MPKCFSCDKRTSRQHALHNVSCCNACEPLHLIMYSEAIKRGLARKEVGAMPFIVEYKWSRYGGNGRKLVSLRRVEELLASPMVQDRLAKKASRNDPAAVEARRQAREARILRRFPSWRDALLPACQALFNLNRYAKHKTCRARDEIYELKNQFVELLYQLGYCTECRIHITELPQQECFACDGTGIWENWSTGEYEECGKCGGDGIYREATALRFVAFRFCVDGMNFAWHQPDYLVDFPYTETAAEDVGGLAEEKPLEMSMQKMNEGKVIIRYVLENAPRLAAA